MVLQRCFQGYVKMLGINYMERLRAVNDWLAKNPDEPAYPHTR